MRRAAPIMRAAVAVAALLCAPGVATAAEPAWRLEQPPPPPGAPFKTSLGAPGDLAFWAPNRGLLGVEGNAVVARGLLYYDGAVWRQLSTVCGGPSDSLRIAWAGPTEFWTVSEPSLPRVGGGITLCRFKDGEVVASYGTAPQAADPYSPMNAAACAGPADCWFGGADATDPTGARSGAFRLHWDGAQLTSSYGPQGRGITDLEAHAGTFLETVLAGRQPGDRTPAELREAETVPRLIHRLSAGRFVADPFEPLRLPGVPDDGSELLALDSDGAQAWAVGGGASSGPSAPQDGVVVRPPIAARGAGPTFFEVARDDPPGAFETTDRFVDVAALPATDAAWVAVQRYEERASTNAKAKVARIDAATGAVEVVRLPVGGTGRGSAVRIACPAADRCWLATSGGWLFHLSDGTPLPRDTEPAFQQLITFRPNESAAQFVPDRPPADDSRIFAPPPLELQPEPAAQQPAQTRRLPALMRRVRSRLRGTTLVVSFTLTRAARVGLVAQRGKRLVARVKARRHQPGRRALRLRLDRRRWPTRLRFTVRELGGSGSGGGDAGGDAPTLTR